MAFSKSEIHEAKTTGNERSPDALIRSAVEGQKVNNRSKIKELEVFAKRDPKILHESFLKVHESYKDQPEMQQECKQLGESMGVEFTKPLDQMVRATSKPPIAWKG